MNLNASLEMWARWVHRGGFLRPETSMLGKLIDNKGVMNYGGGGGTSLDVDSIESNIEAVLMRFAAQVNPKNPREHTEAVLCLRVEYGVIRLRSCCGESSQRQKAAALNVSLRTYQNRLAVIKLVLSTELRI